MPSLAARLYQYQKERFPLLGHGVLIAAFSFSAIGFSRQLRGVEGFIPIWQYLLCVLTSLSVFFLLRVADEHKDEAEDRQYRSYLPVPRGLISLKELRVVGFVFLGLMLVLNASLVPLLLPLLAVTLGYLLLMRYEFFCARWLRSHMAVYMLSHMFIIPLADVYASAYDWRLHGNGPPVGLFLFFGVSYLNGIVLELGRKLRAPHCEEEGVDTYSRLWGLRTASMLWLVALSLNFALTLLAVRVAAYPIWSVAVLIGFFALSLVPLFLFLKKPSAKGSKLVEGISFIWALAMYLTLGGIPQLANLVGG